jgi:signal transduction histidine kinase/HD-like signal output (HDOD) protein
MAGQPPTADPTQVRRVELILEQLDALPTLSAIAVRVLELTADEAAEMRDVTKLVASDPGLASKVLKVCRCSEKGRAANVTTVDRAVVLLGFDALRSAVLSVQVFELFEGVVSAGGEVYSTRASFDRVLFWQHSLAVAIVAEQICARSALRKHFQPSEAFVGGLLHDLGQLCLHLILPRSFDRVCELAVAQNIPLDQACRQTIGVDTHTAGRRIAEHWQLPHQLSDAIWLHGQPYSTLPGLDHKPLIGLITLADVIVRHERIAPLGHGPRGERIAELCEAVGVNPAATEELRAGLHDELAQRAESMGLDHEQSVRQLLRSVSRANEVLGRTNVILRHSITGSRRQVQALEAIKRFHDSAAPGGSVITVLGRVVQAAAQVFGPGVQAVLYQANRHEAWQLYQFDSSGSLAQSRAVLAPDDRHLIEHLSDNTATSVSAEALRPILGDALSEVVDLSKVRMLPLRCGWGVNAVLLHNALSDQRQDALLLETLSRTWGSAIAAGTQHEGAKRLGEQLVEANRELVETQDHLAQVQTMAAVGELAAGAAHEMNNPLTVISGRSQMLADLLIEPEQRSMARQIALHAHRLSDIITALRLFAEPTRAQPRRVDVGELVRQVIGDASSRRRREIEINTVIGNDVPGHVLIDPDQIGRALAELVRNAVESEGSTHVELRVQIDPANDRLKLQVTDDGSGLAPYTLAHAFDPFFSAKPAGRQPGLGLSQARRLVEASGGRVTLENGPHKGAVATIRLPHWREQNEEAPQRNAA